MTKHIVRGDRTLARILQPIAEGIAHPDVTDVVVNRPHEVGFLRSGQWEWHHIPSLDFQTLDAATILIGQRTGKEFDESRPYVNSTLPDGQRFQGVRAPGTHGGRMLWAIRRPPARPRQMSDPDMRYLLANVNKPNIARLVSAKSVSTAYRNKDWWSVLNGGRLAGLSIGLIGPTGQGKSDIVRRLMGVSRPHTRMVTIETDDECGEAGPHNKAPLFYDPDAMTADKAVQIAKRLIPVEIVMQEVRGAEAWTLFNMLNSGHNGLTTWHGDEGKEIEALCEMARAHPSAETMEEDYLRQKAMSAFDIIAYASRTQEKIDDDDKGFRITSLKLMAAELEAA